MVILEDIDVGLEKNDPQVIIEVMSEEAIADQDQDQVQGLVPIEIGLGVTDVQNMIIFPVIEIRIKRL